MVVSGTTIKVEPEQRLPWYTRYAAAGWLVVGILTAAGFLIVGRIGGDQTDSANARTDTVQQQALRVANPVDQLCAEGGATAAELSRRGACSPARSIVATPVIAQAVGPSQEDIESAVAAYLRRNPPPAGRAPTTGEVTAAVVQYLTAHPPQPGRAPTAQEIAVAVQQYLTANPPAAGKDAPAPTDEQVQAAVDAYIAAHPPASGTAGSNGKPPESWTWTSAGGTRHVCTRANDDDSAPTYSCTTEPADPSTPPSTSDGGGLLGLPTG